MRQQFNTGPHVESSAPVGKIFRPTVLGEKADTNLINCFRVGIAIALNVRYCR